VPPGVTVRMTQLLDELGAAPDEFVVTVERLRSRGLVRLHADGSLALAMAPVTAMARSTVDRERAPPAVVDGFEHALLVGDVFLVLRYRGRTGDSQDREPPSTVPPWKPPR
jgi:hypothetical protein